MAARTTLTIQLFSECPLLVASSSALYFTDSGSRRVIRVTVSSSSASVSLAEGARRLRGRRGLRRHRHRGYVDHELRLATLEPDVDGAGRARRRFGGGLRQRVHERQADGGIEGQREPLGRGLGLVAACLGRGREVVPQALDVGGDVHAHHSDITVTSRQALLTSE